MFNKTSERIIEDKYSLLLRNITKYNFCVNEFHPANVNSYPRYLRDYI